MTADPFLNHPGVLPESKWDALAARLRKEPWSAIDTEFAGWTGGEWDTSYDVRERSPAGRVAIFLWSVGVPDLGTDPRGPTAKAVVLPGAALAHDGIADWLRSDRIKVAHNSPVEYHSFQCHGIALGGLVNTLSLARYLLPGRLAYSLDSLSQDIFGIGKTHEFSYFMNEARERVDHEVREKRVDFKTCRCKEEGCKKRKLPEHEKFEHSRIDPVIREKTVRWIHTRTPVELAQSSLASEFVEYSKRDSVLAARLYSHLLGKMEKWSSPLPFASKLSLS